MRPRLLLVSSLKAFFEDHFPRSRVFPAGEYARYVLPVVIFRDIVEHTELSETKEQWISLLA